MKIRSARKINFSFKEVFYKPAGVPMRDIKINEITDEELEALRLRFVENLDQKKSAEKMGISRSQFQRDLKNSAKKIVVAMMKGEAIKISLK